MTANLEEHAKITDQLEQHRDTLLVQIERERQEWAEKNECIIQQNTESEKAYREQCEELLALKQQCQHQQIHAAKLVSHLSENRPSI